MLGEECGEDGEKQEACERGKENKRMRKKEKGEEEASRDNKRSKGAA